MYNGRIFFFVNKTAVTAAGRLCTWARTVSGSTVFLFCASNVCSGIEMELADVSFEEKKDREKMFLILPGTISQPLLKCWGQWSPSLCCWYLLLLLFTLTRGLCFASLYLKKEKERKHTVAAVRAYSIVVGEVEEWREKRIERVAQLCCCREKHGFDGGDDLSNNGRNWYRC